MLEMTFFALWIACESLHNSHVKVHFGPKGHMPAACLVVAYGLLQLFSDACGNGTLKPPAPQSVVFVIICHSHHL